jgi:6-phosphogluconolactonase
MPPTVIISDTPEAQAERAAKDFVELANAAWANQDRIAIALAGGQTPKQFYSRLAQEPYKSSIPWKKIWFFWGDERCVPKEHQDSNFRMAAEALLQYVPVPPAHVIRMRGEDAPPQAACDYEKDLRNFFRGTDLWPTFDLILLGMGPDGHTASLIPGTPAVNSHAAEQSEERRTATEEDGGLPQPRWVVHNVVRSLQTVRLTLTYPVLNHAKHIWFLVSGARKKEAFAEIQNGPNPQVPASLVQPVHGELRWYVDKEVVYGRSEDPSLKERAPVSQRPYRRPGQ